MNNIIKNRKEKLIIITMISSVFIGIYLALNSWLSIKNLELEKYQKNQRKEQTEQLATDSDEDFFIKRKILPLLRLICEDPKLDIKSTRKNFLEKYDLDFSIYKFSKSILVETAPENASNKWLMKNLFPALIEKNIEKIETKRKELDKKIEFVFGYGKNLYSIQSNHEKIIDTVISNKVSFAAWSNRGDSGVIIISNGGANKNKIVKETIKKLKPLPNQIYAGKLNENLYTYHSTNTQNESISSNSLDNLALKAYNYLSKTSQNHGLFDNKEWFFTKTKNNEKYFTVYNSKNNLYHSSLIVFRISIVFLAIFTILIILFQNHSTKSLLNLKKFITLIFVASSILPLTLACTTSLESIETLNNIYQNELVASIEEAIGNIVQNFGNYLIKASDELKVLTTPTDEGLKNIESIKKMEKIVTARFPETRFTARNTESNVIYSNIISFSEGQESIFKSLCNRFLEKYKPERLNGVNYSGNEFSDTLLKKDDLPFCVVVNYPEQLQFIKNSDFSVFLFIKAFEAKFGDVALIEIQPQIKNLIKEYTQTINKRNLVAKQQIINLAAFNPVYFKWYLPPDNYAKPLFEQAKTAYVLNKPIFRRIYYNNEEIYSLCIPNSNYEDICYIGFLSTDLFKNKIISIKRSVLLGAVIAIIMLICIISWLMNQIIRPLNNLEIGIKALSEHKFEIKIPVPNGKDELVTLFKEFNFMMGENYDMQMAKNVQEGLITTKFPRIEGYYINGFSIPLEDLSGDCLTSYTMPDGKILFLVGDLTGQGIGSALMMSFVRSITFNWSQTLKEDPSSLVKYIDNMLRENQMGHMFMGVVCGILNPKNDEIIFVTCGHIFPLFFRKNGNIEWLGTPYMPLGKGKKHEFEVKSTILLPGERLLCITNGLLAFTKDDIQLSYSQIEKWAKNSLDENNSNWLKSIEFKYQEYCHENKAFPIDDITLFTIINEKKEV